MHIRIRYSGIFNVRVFFYNGKIPESAASQPFGAAVWSLVGLRKQMLVTAWRVTE
jgi:hypothetical protein